MLPKKSCLQKREERGSCLGSKCILSRRNFLLTFLKVGLVFSQRSHISQYLPEMNKSLCPTVSFRQRPKVPQNLWWSRDKPKLFLGMISNISCFRIFISCCNLSRVDAISFCVCVWITVFSSQIVCLIEMKLFCLSDREVNWEQGRQGISGAK